MIRASESAGQTEVDFSKAHSAPKEAKTPEKSPGKSKVRSSEEKAIRSGFEPGPPPLPRPQPGPTQIGPGSQPPQAFQQAGQFAISILSYFVTAVGGGGKTTDVLHTDAVSPRAWEKFTLWFIPSTGEYGIQTLNGEFLLATNGGDLASLIPFGNQEVDTIQSTAEYIIDYERFSISPDMGDQVYPTGYFTIRTVRGFYLIAGGDGRQTVPPVFYTNGTTETATTFQLLKSGDAGSGYSFAFVVAGGPAFVPGGAASGGPLPIGSSIIVSNGGGEDGTDDAPLTISPIYTYVYERQLTLIRQNDGTYAFQTSSGFYVTANGGGAAGDFRTDARQVGNWQKFTLTPNNDCTYYVQAYNGYYLGVAVGGMLPGGPDIYIPATTPDITQAVKWRLWVRALAPTMPTT